MQENKRKHTCEMFQRGCICKDRRFTIQDEILQLRLLVRLSFKAMNLRCLFYTGRTIYLLDWSYVLIYQHCNNIRISQTRSMVVYLGDRSQPLSRISFRPIVSLSGRPLSSDKVFHQDHHKTIIPLTVIALARAMTECNTSITIPGAVQRFKIQDST